MDELADASRYPSAAHNERPRQHHLYHRPHRRPAALTVDFEPLHPLLSCVLGRQSRVAEWVMRSCYDVILQVQLAVAGEVVISQSYGLRIPMRNRRLLLELELLAA